MAKTQKWKPKRIRDEEERRAGSSGFINLDDGQKFLGYALFEADPKKDEPGYYEYRQHWSTAAKRSIPCADEDCPLCEDGDKPKEVAYTLWLVLEDENGNKLNGGEGELRTFRINSLVIKQFTEMRSESEKIKGRLFRVSRTSEKGDYMLMPKDRKLKASEVKELAKSDSAPDYDQMVTSQLNKAMEGIAISRAMDDDDEEDNDVAKPKGGKGKSKKKDTNAWPEDGDGEVVTIKKVDDENFLMVESEDYDGTRQLWGTPDIDVTELEKGDKISVDWVTDDDDDLVLTDDPEAEESEEDEEDAKTNGDGDIEDEDYEIVKVSKKEGFIVVEHDDEETQLWAGEDTDVSDFSKGDTVTVSAEWTLEDEEDEDTGYWLLTSIAESDGEGAKEDEDEDENGGTDADDLPDEIEDEEFVVKSKDEAESTMEVESEELELAFTLYFLDQGPASKVDFDDYEEGAKIILSAEKDSVGDMVATSVPKVKKAKASGKKKSDDKKGGKKASGSKAKKDTGKKASGSKAKGGKKKGGKK